MVEISLHNFRFNIFRGLGAATQTFVAVNMESLGEADYSKKAAR